MNALTFRATRRETSRMLKVAAYLRDHMGGIVCLAGFTALLIVVGTWA